MNIAYDLEFDLDGFLHALEKRRVGSARPRRSARQRVDEYQDARRRKKGSGYDENDK